MKKNVLALSITAMVNGLGFASGQTELLAPQPLYVHPNDESLFVVSNHAHRRYGSTYGPASAARFGDGIKTGRFSSHEKLTSNPPRPGY